VGNLRWQLADEPTAQGSLFEAPVFEREPGKGEFRGMEFLHVKARSIINEVKNAPFGFQHTINAYRGCSHACTYCLVGDTPILLADGRTRLMADIRPGDEVYGTARRGAYRRYVPTTVLDHWSTLKRAFRVTLEDGTELVTSGDHRFLTERGWKHVAGTECGAGRRPHLTTHSSLVGVGRLATTPPQGHDYETGYLCGVLRSEAPPDNYAADRPGRPTGDVHRFRLATTDDEMLARTRSYLGDRGGPNDLGGFETRQGLRAIRTRRGAGVATITEVIAWPTVPTADWSRGLLAGVFDAEGSCSRGTFRIADTDDEIIRHTEAALRRFRFRYVVEDSHRANRLRSIRLLGGLREQLRFFLTVDPAITRKRTFDGQALESDANLKVAEIEPLGIDLPMYDITTGTGDFIANGVVSHNCFARPSHTYLDLDAGEDFERKIVVKVNAVSLLRSELDPRKWSGELIAMGTNTDPYQRCEGKYRLTRGIVEVLAEHANPFSILTKSTLVLRDRLLLAEAARRTSVRVNLSIGTLDESVWRATEPGTPHPLRRVRAVEALNAAGIPCGVLIGPVLPHLSDGPEQLEAVVKACVEAGAQSISTVLLHLRPGVKEVFLPRLAESHPQLIDEYHQLYGNRAYAPRVEQRAVERLVRGFVHQYAGVSADRLDPRHHTGLPGPDATNGNGNGINGHGPAAPGGADSADDDTGDTDDDRRTPVPLPPPRARRRRRPQDTGTQLSLL
jgi:DNA repair photolyase